MGPPNGGKTTVALNLILWQEPVFEQVYLIHVDGKFSQEYNQLGKIKKLEDIPNPDWWEGKRKSVVVIEDLAYENLNKQQKKNLDRLFGYVSTHKNLSVILTAQDAFRIICIVRRCANLWILWKLKDKDECIMLARKAGLTKEQLLKIMDGFGIKDSLWLDYTPDSPWPIRVNGIESVEDRLGKTADPSSGPDESGDEPVAKKSKV
jgi:hypothetical protein